MEIISDLHLHSKYSRAVSKDMNLYNMALWGAKKGLDLLSTGDWTHPLWLKEIKRELAEDTRGIYKLKKHPELKTKFILTVEISSIYSQNGKTRRIHNLIFAPNIEIAEKINNALIKRGCNLASDGRPIIGLTSIELIELIYSIDANVLLMPCHVWTPWYGLYGANSGFDSISECFGEYENKIFGIETGISSDPFMNWQIKELKTRSIISASDAHSLPKMGREATVFVNRIPDDKNILITYADIISAIKKENSSKLKVGYTVEFYPEEGKYHYAGHRKCNFVQAYAQTQKMGRICPVCSRSLTGGVVHRINELSGKDKPQKETYVFDSNGVKWIKDPSLCHPSFTRLVPLNEIIAESMHSTVLSKKVKEVYDKLCIEFNSELHVLLHIPIVKIEKLVGQKVGEGIQKVRAGKINILPGFDGQYGIVKIWNDKVINDKYKSIANQLGLDF